VCVEFFTRTSTEKERAGWWAIAEDCGEVAAMAGTPRIILALSAVFLFGLLGTRLSTAPLSPYGEQGAEYLEHADRLQVVLATRQIGLEHPLRWLEEVDRAFPPGIHLLGAPLGAIFGHDATSISRTAPLWLILFALALGSVVGSLDPKGARPGERAVSFAVGATAALLLPAAHAAATRYHYDLPMATLLWTGVAVQLRLQDRRPLLAGAFAGLFLALAAFTKWSALPLGVPLLLGASLAPRRRDTFATSRPVHYRALALGAAGVVSSLLVTAYLTVSMESLLSMAGTFEVPGGTGESIWSRFDGGLVEGVTTILSSVGESVPHAPRERLVTYLVHVVTAMLSPLGAVLVSLLCLPWFARGAPGLLMAAVALSCQFGFLVLGTPPMDERFLLPSLPFAVIAVAGGWRSLSEGSRPAFAGLLLLSGFFIAWDFHHGPESWWNRPKVVRVSQTEMPHSQGRRFMLASSFGARGWVRRDEQRHPRTQQRHDLWEAIEECGPVVVVHETSGVLDPLGDGLWWQYRGLLSRVQGGDPPVILSWRDQDVGLSDPDFTLLVTGTKSQPELRDLPGPWEAARELPEPGGSGRILLWHRPDGRLCR